MANKKYVLKVNNTEPDEFGNVSVGGGGTTGDYIPLSGTEVGKPVTGPLKFIGSIGTLICETDSLSSLDLSEGYSILNGKQVYIGNVNDSKNYIRIDDDGGIIIYDNSNQGGINGQDYYGEYYYNNSYTQKKYVDQATSYSTTETKTGGTWIDGKPIYRKVIEVDTFNNGIGILEHELSIENYIVKKFRGYFNRGNILPIVSTYYLLTLDLNTNAMIDSSDSLSFGEVNTDSNIIEIEGLSDGSFELLGQIILEYTKTTD